jgi:glycosyltransferase involved in cell wall biosynthesis
MTAPRKRIQRWIRAARWRLRATQDIWRLGELRQVKRLLKGPAPRGVLDSPVADEKLPRGPIGIFGWALFPEGPATRVELWLGREMMGLARIGLSRVDLRSHIDVPHAGVCGFELVIDTSSWTEPDGETTISAVAISAAGERLELAPVPVTVEAALESLPAPLHRQRFARRQGRSGARRVLVFTHQLDLGGAQLYLLDLIRQLVKRDDIELTVISTLDGLLREEFEALGIPVHITSIVPIGNLNAHRGRIEELKAWAAPHEFEAVLVNTATMLAIPGAELAHELDIPLVWAIHESFDPDEIWAGLDPSVRRHLNAALRGAAAVLFEADATREMYEPLTGLGRCLTIPYGVDFEPIDTERAGFDQGVVRRRAGIPVDAQVVLCVGTIEPRKAQVPLTQAFDSIAARHPDAHLVFVGARKKDPRSLLLAEYVESCRAADRIMLIPITPNVQPWYGLADILVCASDVESLPRTVLEAMAWETPVLATNVFGLPDLIDDGETGWLCAPRSFESLATALDRALSSTAEERRRIGASARARVQERHSLHEYSREIGDLLARVVKPEPAIDARNA